MPRKRTSKNYAIQPFRIGPDRIEIDLLAINFRAENLAGAQERSMIYAENSEFMKAFDGLKLLRNNAEVWRWLKDSPG